MSEKQDENEIEHLCPECYEGELEDYGLTDTGYSMYKCNKCGYILSEE